MDTYYNIEKLKYELDSIVKNKSGYIHGITSCSNIQKVIKMRLADEELDFETNGWEGDYCYWSGDSNPDSGGFVVTVDNVKLSVRGSMFYSTFEISVV